MSFKLSKRSLKNLEGVDSRLVDVVNIAITVTEVDFMVIEGLRTRERQAQLVKAGASMTMNSQHLLGRAVDLAAWVGGTVRWDWPLYPKIAEAMRTASRKTGTRLVWGGCWDRSLNEIEGSCAVAVESYVARRRQLELSAFIDGPHFELDRRVHT